MEESESYPAQEAKPEPTAVKRSTNGESWSEKEHEHCRKRPFDPEIEPELESEPSIKRKSASIKERSHWKRKEQLTRYMRQLQQEERELRIQQRRDRSSISPQKTSPRPKRTPSPSPASSPQKRVTFSSP